MDGVIQGFHDAELYALKQDRQSDGLSLYFECVSGDKKEVHFSGVVNFRMEDYRPQNVVSRLLISTVPPNPSIAVEGLVTWVSSSSDGHVFTRPEILRELVDKVASGELLLFYLEPSFGAEVCIIAKAYRTA